MLVDDNSNESLNKIVDIYIKCYISGLENMNDLRLGAPEIYEDILRLEQSYKQEVSIKTLINTDKSMNRSIFESILRVFDSKLQRVFSDFFDEALISELKHDLIASWLTDYSMEFRSE